MLPIKTRRKMSESKRARDIARIAAAAGCSAEECEERLASGQRYCARHRAWRTAAKCWRCDQDSYRDRRAKRARAA